MTVPSRCPSSWAIERSMLAEAPHEIQAHIDKCERCQGDIAERRAQAEGYMSSHAASQVRRQLRELEHETRGDAHARQPTLPRMGLVALSAAVAAAVAIGYVGRVDSPSTALDGEQLAPKGAAQLSLWVGDEGTAARPMGTAVGEQRARAGERIQPALTLATGGHVALLIRSPRGEVTALVSDGGTRSTPVAARAGEPIGPSFRLDEERGTYRVVLFLQDEPFPIQDVMHALAADMVSDFEGTTIVRSFSVGAE